MSLQILKKNTRHPFHLVDPSPWPFTGALFGFSLLFGNAMFMHSYRGGWFLLMVGFIGIILTMYVWWRDIVREATIEGNHTAEVQKGLRMGVILFICSEIMFFVAFFWAFFDASLKPAMAIGGVWPPSEFSILNPWGIPLLNTVILLSSGATLTLSHHTLIAGRKTFVPFHLLVATIILGIFFTFLQGFEYINAPFSIADGIYGSTFFMATGFHGLHVLVGTIFLIVCAVRMYNKHFTAEHHFGFEAAAWYWHFVDVVWLFLFVSIYWWGS